MAQKIQSVKGMNDLYPLAAEGMDVLVWHRLEAAARKIFPAFGYDEIRTPIAEPDVLFRRAVGETTDIVEKETYTFDDKDGSLLTLRPEGTAGVVRAFVEHGLSQTKPAARYWYLGPMFRRERPQKGRYRQFWQLGAECFGQKSPRADAEQLAMLDAFYRDVGLKGVSIELSSLGDASCRPQYKAELQAWLRERAEKLCGECRARIEKNPLRVLDCKKPDCREVTRDAPQLLDRLCAPCKEHFAEVTRNLDLLGVAYHVNPRIVRGLDYYVRTTFELVHHGEGLGSQNAVGGGGRYDGLVKELGGADVPGIGFGLGMERMVLALQAQEGTGRAPASVFIASMNAKAGDRAMALARELRGKGLRVDLDYENTQNVGKQISKGESRGAKAALVLGEDELAKGVVQVKDLARREQAEMSLSDVDALAKRLETILRG